MSAAAGPSPRPHPHRAQIEACWRALVRPGDLHEVRIPKTRRGPARLFGTTAGYFDDGGRCVRALATITGTDAEAVYISLNPVKPELRARADNRLVTGIAATTADADVTVRRHLLIDIDSNRAAAISATDAERDAALSVRDAVGAYLTDFGWPDPLYRAMTGNGGALVYRTDLPNDEASLALVTGCLAALADAFDSDAVTIDQSVGNAARVTKLIGTVAAKGDHCPDLGRVWRLATAEFNVEAPVVPRELLVALAARAPGEGRPDGAGRAGGSIFGPATRHGQRSWTVREVLTRKGIGWREVVKPYGRVYELDCCLTSVNHSDGAAIVELASGALDYKCHHNTCRDRGWPDARSALGLDARPSRRTGGAAASPGGRCPADEEPAQPFPVETLPAEFRALVEEGAAALVAPPDFIAVPLLVEAGAAIGDALEIELKPGWREGPNLNAAGVGDPGSKKTPAFGLAMRPIYRIQKRLKRDYDAAMAEHRQELAAWEAKKKPDRGPRPEPPTFRHLVTTDATTEALAPMLLASKGLLLFKDELTGWVRGMDQYRGGGKGADRQHYLSMWSRTLIKVDRKSSPEPIIVPRPCLSVFGGIQPDLLPDLADAAQREDGFLDRLLWSFPDKVPDRWTTDDIGLETVQVVEAVFDRLYRLEGDTDEDGEAVPRAIRLGAEAAALWGAWYAEHAAEAEAGDFPRRLCGPWAKMPAQLARLALILHALRAHPVSDRVAAGTLGAAADLIDYFKAHARRVYRHLGRERRDLVTVILAALKERGPLTQSDFLHHVFKRNVPAERIRATLETLEDAGLVVRDVLREPGRPPATIWSLA